MDINVACCACCLVMFLITMLTVLLQLCLCGTFVEFSVLFLCVFQFSSTFIWATNKQSKLETAVSHLKYCLSAKLNTVVQRGQNTLICTEIYFLSSSIKNYRSLFRPIKKEKITEEVCYDKKNNINSKSEF